MDMRNGGVDEEEEDDGLINMKVLIDLINRINYTTESMVINVDK